MDETTNTTPPPEWDSETKAGRRLAGSKLDAARQAVATLDGVVKWAAYEDEADKSLVVTTGPAIKALGDGKIGGHLVIFGGEDLTGDFFGEAEQTIGLTRHCRRNDHHLMSGVMPFGDASRDIFDALCRAHRCTAVFVYE